MLAAPMEQHSSPLHLGDRLEQLAPPRARSTSPFQRLWLHSKGRMPGGNERPDATVHHERSPSFTNPPIPNEQFHMMPAPLRPAVRSARSTNNVHLPADASAGALLQLTVYSPRSPRDDEYMSEQTPDTVQDSDDGDNIQSPVAYVRSASAFDQHQSTHYRQHSFDPPAIEEPLRSDSDANASAMAYHRNVSAIAATASAPVTPRYPPHEMDHKVPSPRNERSAKFRISTFADAQDFGLFAEAMSGLGPDPGAASLSPAPAQVSSFDAGNSVVSPMTPENSFPSFAAFAPRNLAPAPTFPPVATRPSVKFEQPMQMHPAFRAESGANARTSSPDVGHDLALSGAMSGMDIDPRPREEQEEMIDDELPDYEQSQREAADQARFKALNRARELESRWAASTPHRFR